MTLPSPPHGTKLPDSYVTKATDLLTWDFPFTTPDYTQSRAASFLVALEKGIHWEEIQLQFDSSNQVLIVSTERFPALGSIEKIKGMLQMTTDTSAFQEVANTITSNNAAYGNTHRNAYIIPLPFIVAPEPYSHSTSCPAFTIFHVETDGGKDDDNMSNHVTFLQVTLKKSDHIEAPRPGPIKPPEDTPVRFIASPVKTALREKKKQEEEAREAQRREAVRRIAELEQRLAQAADQLTQGQREMNAMQSAAQEQIRKLRDDLATAQAQAAHAQATNAAGVAPQNQYNVGGVQFPRPPNQARSSNVDEMQAIADFCGKSVEDLTDEDVDTYFGL